MLFVFFLFLMVAGTQAQIPGTGPCKDIPGMANYDRSQIVGVWYGYGTYLDCTPKGKCALYDFVDLPDGSTVHNVRQLSIEPDTFEVQQSAVLLTYLGDGTYNVTQPRQSVYFNHPLVVWDTDYVSYYVKGSCVNAGESSLNYAWAATRSQNPSPSVIAKIDEVLKNVGVSKEYMYIYNQTDCPSGF